MKITKYAHACLVLEENNQRLIIDPGAYMNDFSDHENVCAIVITHEHGDHFGPEVVDKIMTANPEAKIFSTAAVVLELEKYSAMVVKPMETVKCGPFEMAFYGGQHAPVHDVFPVGENVGVLVNKTLYYPGDSFSLPEGETPEVLAVPVSGPWLKAGEAVDFLLAVKPKRAFQTHDSLNAGHAATMLDDLLKSAAKSINTEYLHLAVGESLTV